MGIQAIIDPIIAGIVSGGGEAAAGAGAAGLAAGAADVGAPLILSAPGAASLAGGGIGAIETGAEAAAGGGIADLLSGGVAGTGVVAPTGAEALGAGAGAVSAGVTPGEIGSAIAGGGLPDFTSTAGVLGGLGSDLTSGALSTGAGAGGVPAAGATPEAAAQAGGSALTSPLSLSSSPLSSTLPSAGAAGSGTAPGSAIATAAPSGIAGGATDVTSLGLPDVTSQLPQGAFASLPGDTTGAGAGAAAPAAGAGGAAAPADPGVLANLGQGNFGGALGDVGSYLGKNPLLALGAAGLGANFLLGNQTPGLKAVKAQAQPAAINAANQAQIAAADEQQAAAIAPNAIADRQAGEQLQSYESSGLLPPGMQAALTQQQLSGEAGIRARSVNQASGGASSAEAQDLQSLGIQVAGQAATVAQGLWSQGTTMLQQALSETQQELSALGASESALASAGGEISNIAQIYETIMQTEVSQDAQLGQSIANFSGAAAGMSMRPTFNVTQTQPAAA